MKYQRNRTTSKGLVIVEAAFALSMVIAGGVLASMLVLYSGVSMYSKKKLSLVTSQAAVLAVSISSNANALDQTKAFVEQLMPEVGLTPHNLNVTLRQSTNGSQQGVTVTISNQFPMIGSGALAPAQLQIIDSEFAAPPECSCP